jgi:hypothetical protein
VTLEQTYLSALLLDSLLRIEHQRALPFLFGGPSGSSALLRGQAAVHFAFERANELWCSRSRGKWISWGAR